MRNRHTLRCSTCKGLGLLAIVALLTVGGPNEAAARPSYKKAFEKTYEVNEKVTCNACHGKSKKMRNDYADAMMSHLDGKNVKDEDKIIEALKATEADGDVDGKTYGEILKAGELPPPYVEGE